MSSAHTEAHGYEAEPSPAQKDPAHSGRTGSCTSPQIQILHSSDHSSPCVVMQRLLHSYRNFVAVSHSVTHHSPITTEALTVVGGRWRGRPRVATRRRRPLNRKLKRIPLISPRQMADPEAVPAAKPRAAPRPLKKRRVAMAAAGLAAASLPTHPLSVLMRVPAVLDMLAFRDASALRVADKALLVIVAEHPWGDQDTTVTSGLSKWRACFPRATSVSIGGGRMPEKSWRAHVRGVRCLVSDQPLALASADVAGGGSLAGLETLGVLCEDDAATVLAALAAGEARSLRELRAVAGPVNDSHIAACRSLRCLSFCAASTELTAAGFQHLGGLINVHLCSRVPSSRLDDPMLAALRSATHLSFGRMHIDATGACFASLPKLTNLQLPGCVFGAGAASFFASLPASVVSLSLASSHGVPWESAYKACGELRELNVSGVADRIPTSAWAPLVRLEVLVADNVGLGTLSGAALAQLCSLRKLRLRASTCDLTDAAIAQMPNLRGLDLTNFQGIVTFSGEAFVPVPLLEELILCNAVSVSIAGDPATAFASLVHLRHLSVAGMAGAAWACDAIVTVLPALLRLDISNCYNFTAAAFPWLRGLVCLRAGHCLRMVWTDAALACLAGLTHVMLHDCVKSADSQPGLTAAGWAHLADVPYLNVAGNAIPSEALALIWAGAHRVLMAPRVPTAAQQAVATTRQVAAASAKAKREEAKALMKKLALRRREKMRKGRMDQRQVRSARGELSELLRDEAAARRHAEALAVLKSERAADEAAAPPRARKSARPPRQELAEALAVGAAGDKTGPAASPELGTLPAPATQPPPAADRPE